jgi:acyl-CoA reductase-like NAD-dependent aldehyde dehydrogenase
MALLQQETFGPIIPVVQFDDEHEALHAATDSEFGLTATVYGGDAAFAARLRRSFGTVFHNTCIGAPENATCRAYWGGFRESGWIWEWRGGNFCRREGPRLFVREFTV